MDQNYLSKHNKICAKMVKRPMMKNKSKVKIRKIKIKDNQLSKIYLSYIKVKDRIILKDRILLLRNLWKKLIKINLIY